MTPAEAIERSKANMTRRAGSFEQAVKLCRESAEKYGAQRWYEESVELGVKSLGEGARGAYASREFRQYVAGLLGMC